MVEKHVDPAPEFCRPVAVDRIGRAGIDAEIEAEPAERAALARRFGLIELRSLAARCRLVVVQDGLIRLEGTWSAEVVQACVVTLEPVAARLEGQLTASFAAGLSRDGDAREIVLDVGAENEPELIQGGAIDLGEAVAQELGVSIDPFPRAPGARLPETEALQARAGGPFSALKPLKH